MSEARILYAIVAVLLPLVAYLLREAHRQILARLDSIETNVTRRLDHIEMRLAGLTNGSLIFRAMPPLKKSLSIQAQAKSNNPMGQWVRR
jgi:hypothetical protein